MLVHILLQAEAAINGDELGLAILLTTCSSPPTVLLQMVLLNSVLWPYPKQRTKI